ncbi:MAG TPA: hypothetical protein VF287_07175 [Usitatibacter sp.]
MRPLPFLAALALAGCATSYELTVMPQDSGKLYSGTADENANGEGRISITIEGKTYSGTWIETQSSQTTGYVTGGFGFRRGGLGSFVTMDNPQGSESKALLTAPDGSGLRCDFKAGQGRGGGMCRDDKGRMYDVQVRPARK